jgi:hypothetical protein
MWHQYHTVKMCHSRLMENILPWSILFVFYPCNPHGCSGEVTQRTLHLCSLCGGFPQVVRNAESAIIEVLATKSDIRMVIPC